VMRWSDTDNASKRSTGSQDFLLNIGVTRFWLREQFAAIFFYRNVEANFKFYMKVYIVGQ
jgi:hypothetical protein